MSGRLALDNLTITVPDNGDIAEIWNGIPLSTRQNARRLELRGTLPLRGSLDLTKLRQNLTIDAGGADIQLLAELPEFIPAIDCTGSAGLHIPSGLRLTGAYAADFGMVLARDESSHPQSSGSHMMRDLVISGPWRKAALYVIGSENTIIDCPRLTCTKDCASGLYLSYRDPLEVGSVYGVLPGNQATASVLTIRSPQVRANKAAIGAIVNDGYHHVVIESPYVTCGVGPQIKLLAHAHSIVGCTISDAKLYGAGTYPEGALMIDGHQSQGVVGLCFDATSVAANYAVVIRMTQSPRPEEIFLRKVLCSWFDDKGLSKPDVLTLDQATCSFFGRYGMIEV